MNEGVQLSLKLQRPATYRREDFVVSPTNESAVRALDAWPDWLGGALALVGPEGAGKTHLATDWAQQADAAAVRPGEVVDLAGLEGRPVVVDDADRLDDETLFHLINLAGLPGGGLLLTSRDRPAAWACSLPDLRSRLNALRVVELGGPDDTVLRGVLLRFFEQSSIRPSEDLLAYLVRRIERAVPKAREVVALLEEAAGPELRPVTRALAREILDAEPDLFD